MKLTPHPKGGVQVGISDILQWRDCAARMEFGMRRHAQGDPPESWSPENAYGSAIHDCLSLLDNGYGIEEAIQVTFPRFKQWLEPSDISRLREDMEKYLARELLGVRTLLNEGEISVRLFVHPVVGQVWFRARIDRLYQSLDDPAVLIHVDYKSSKWPKSQKEVDEDLQLWSYNWGMTEWFVDRFPELEDELSIEQTYDQLMYGQLNTRKGPTQRASIKSWLVTAVTAIIEDEQVKPTFNEWCPWCPLKMDCPVVRYELTDWALARIAALMPREERFTKDGSPSKRPGPVRLDRERIREYAELLPEVHRAGQVLERFDKEVREVMKQMPDGDLARLGKKKTDRSRRTFTTEAKRRIVEEVGLPTALRLFDLSLSAIDSYYADERDTAERLKDYAEKQRGAVLIEDL